MEIAPEYLLGGVLLLIVAATVLVVAVVGVFVILQPGMGLSDVSAAIFPTTTTTSTTTTTTTESTTTSTSTTSTTTTSTTESTTTTEAPFYICEDTLTESGMVPTRCQNKGAFADKLGKPSAWFDSSVSATVTYNLTNAVSGYNDFSSRVAGNECRYAVSKVNMKFTVFMTCEIPTNLTKTKAATLKRH